MRLPGPEWFERWEALPLKAGQDRRAAALELRSELERRAGQGELIVENDALAVLRREPWDCDRLGLEAAKLDGLVIQRPQAGRALLEAALASARKKGFVHLCARLDTRDRLGPRALQEAGFYLVDTAVTLGLDKPSSWPEPEPPRPGAPEPNGWRSSPSFSSLPCSAPGGGWALSRAPRPRAGTPGWASSRLYYFSYCGSVAHWRRAGASSSLGETSGRSTGHAMPISGSFQATAPSELGR